MSYFTIILLAYALSIDACLVSFSYGLTFTSNRMQNSTQLAIVTSIFQGLMPILGYYLTGIVKTFVQPYAPLIVFLIFSYLGIRFIMEAFAKEKTKTLCLGIKCLLLVGIATSIDAFSAGISLSLYGNLICKPALLISGITFVNSLLGFYLGGKLKHLPTKFLEIAAGLLLIILGIKAVI